MLDCINNTGVDKALTLNKMYEKLTEDDTCYVIKNDEGKVRRYCKSRFRVPIIDSIEDLEELHVTIPRNMLVDIYEQYTYTEKHIKEAKEKIENIKQEVQKYYYIDDAKPTLWDRIVSYMRSILKN